MSNPKARRAIIGGKMFCEAAVAIDGMPADGPMGRCDEPATLVRTSRGDVCLCPLHAPEADRHAAELCL